MTNLKKEIEAIEYDHWMLHETGRLMQRGTRRLAEANALVESHVMHLRTLAEFLFKKTDSRLMKAGDDIFGAKWSEDWPVGMYDAVYVRASEEVAHLSRGRLNNPKTSWLPAFAETIDAHFQRWLARASDEVRQLFAQAKDSHAAILQIAEDSPATATNQSGAISTSSANSRIIGM